jgi:dipeptidyl aminopeptidase/acylaminoacyl peptidase
MAIACGVTTTAPYGSWRSPITADVLVERVVGLSFPRASGDTLYWLESRPSEAGRSVLVRRDPDGRTSEVFPDTFSARTLVHEYGGLCYAVDGETVFFSNFADQRLYRVEPGRTPSPITPAPPTPRSFRYADPVVSPDGSWLVCVRERHLTDEVSNDLVVVPTDGSSEPRALAGGHDFFSSPCLRDDGGRLCWRSWDHPRMPWDGTELWEADVRAGYVLGPPRLVAGGPEESIAQPRYSRAGALHFVSDRTGWWNLYAVDGNQARPLAPMAAEFAGPDWVFGQSTYTWLADGSLVAAWSQNGLDRLGILAPGADRFDVIATPYSDIGGIQPFNAGVVAIAASASEAPAVVEIAVPGGRHHVLKASREGGVDAAYLSAPRPIEFPAGAGLSAYALFYPPANADYVAPADDRPPLIVVSHGGPTAATSGALNYGIQYWTSRGFAVVDVNYGGSTGYGRAYRERLNGNWGVVDVDDCIGAARWLAEHDEIDGRRMVIRGGSAGGYTTLCAVTFHDVFAAGASHFGVADAGALARDTHKFESRYLDGLIGPWPEAEAIYEARSPIFHTDRLRTPLILFQGLEDMVVPPEQAEMMARALADKGVPFAHLTYEGEQHGFRQAKNIKRTAEAELAFYGKVLGFTPADEIEPIEIHNSSALPVG